MTVSDAILTQLLAQLNALQVSQQTMQAKVRIDQQLRSRSDVVNFQLDSIANQKQTSAPASPPSGLKTQAPEGLTSSGTSGTPEVPSPLVLKAALSSSAPEVVSRPIPTTDKERERLLYPGRINLTSE
jgi:TolA-binding protein